MNFRNKWRLLILVLPLLLFALLWHKSAQRPRLLPGLGGSVTSLAFSPDSKTLVCATGNGYLQKWVPEISKWRSFQGANGYMTNLPPLFARPRFSPDGRTVYAGGSRFDQSYTSAAHAWDMATRRHKFGFNYLSGPIFDVSADGRWAAWGDRNGVQVADLNAKPLPLNRARYGAPKDFRFLPVRRAGPSTNAAITAPCVAFSPDSATLAVGGVNFIKGLMLWDVGTGKPRPPGAMAPSVGTPSALAWSPDDRRIAALSTTGISIWDLAHGPVASAPWPTARVPVVSLIGYIQSDATSLEWSPDGKTLFTGGDEVRQWRASDLKLERSFGVGGPAAVSPDGRTLATPSPHHRGTPDGVWLWPLG